MVFDTIIDTCIDIRDWPIYQPNTSKYMHLWFKNFIFVFNSSFGELHHVKCDYILIYE
jgi:hypothetical protein